MTVQRALYDEAQQIREAFALAEQRAGENSLQLLANGIPLGFRFRRPRGGGATVRIDGMPRLRTIPPGDNFITSAMGVFRALQLLRSKAAARAVVEPDRAEHQQ